MVDGKPVVALEHDEANRNTEIWNNALIVYVVGRDPIYSYMENFIAKPWNSVGNPDLFLH